MIRSKDFSSSKNPMRELDVLLSTYAYALCSITSAVTDRSLDQLIHNQDIIIKAKADLNWSSILRAKK